MMRRIVVVGGSLAGHHAAAALRGLGYDGAVTVIGSERHRPYDRYPLSKAFLNGTTDRAGIDLPADVPDVDWRLGSTATGVNLRFRVVLTDDGVLPFDGLVVATGARARHRDLVAGLEGAFVLRTVDDAVALRAALATPSRRVVVVGGGLIGAELAATSVEAGHRTTWVHAGGVPTVHSVGALVAEHLSSLLVGAGVRRHPHARVRELVAEGAAVAGVVLEDGSRLRADVVVMATGTVANDEWLRGAGLVTGGGLHCEASLFATGTDRVVGAGDVVRAPYPLLDGDGVRVEHWASTRHQAALAVENLLAGPDRARPLTSLPEFGTTIHGTRVRGIGFPQAAERGGVVWGSLAGGAAVVALSRRGRTVALVSVDADDVLRRLAAQIWPECVADRARAAEPVLS